MPFLQTESQDQTIRVHALRGLRSVDQGCFFGCFVERSLQLLQSQSRAPEQQLLSPLDVRARTLRVASKLVYT
jgi:hypothetical protein